ncbi:MAG TPA: SMI1/KNR4 family protein [Gemmataceae bacterium]|nr:SMI1/KNR4 family protein [Gemmataceae bacterium]
MQQFTRALTREIEVGGERLALTLSKDGLSVRPVGGRRPPQTMSWAACLCACVANAGQEPPADQVEQAIDAVRKGGPKAAEKPTASEEHPPAEKKPAGTANAPRSEPIAPSSLATAADKVTVLLARLDQWMNSKRERFQQALQPGATSAECDALAAQLGKPLPEELRALLMWHNGQNPDVPGAFEQNWMLMNTEEIADAKKELDDHPHEGWQKNWLPFLDDENGDYRCLDLGSPGCPVLECWRGRADHPVVAPSLAAWLESFVTALEHGAYAEDPERGTLALKG